MNLFSSINKSLRISILSAHGDTIVLDAGTRSGLHPGARFQVHRLLETVPDPYDPSLATVLDYLSARIGSAEVLEVGVLAALARYTGIQPPKAGDFATSTEY